MKFENEPFGFWQAVCILRRSFGDNTLRTLDLDRRSEPYVTIEEYGGSYDQLCYSWHYAITRSASDELRQLRLVIGDPYWGGRSTVKFVPTDLLDHCYDHTIAPRFEPPRSYR